MKSVVFVDDLNMPSKEQYGAQPPIEILRQWMDHQGWYDRKENEFKRLVDVQFCAAMGPPGGGRTRITQRYVRHFNLINFINFSNESLARVFSTILDWRLSQGFQGSVKQLSPNIVQATIDIYNTIGYLIVGLFCYICSFLFFLWLFSFLMPYWLVYVLHVEERYFNTLRL
jgi:dynein heavy chain